MVGCGGVHSFGLFLVGSGNSQDPFFHVRSGCLWPCRGSGLEIVWSHKVAFLIACALGAVVNFAGYMVIKYAGALTLKVRSKQNQKTRHTHIGTRKCMVVLRSPMSFAGVECYSRIKDRCMCRGCVRVCKILSRGGK